MLGYIREGAGGAFREIFFNSAAAVAENGAEAREAVRPYVASGLRYASGRPAAGLVPRGRRADAACVRLVPPLPRHEYGRGGAGSRRNDPTQIDLGHAGGGGRADEHSSQPWHPEVRAYAHGRRRNHDASPRGEGATAALCRGQKSAAQKEA